MTYVALAVVLVVASLIIYANLKGDKSVEHPPLMQKEEDFAPETTVTVFQGPKPTPEVSKKSDIVEPTVKKKTVAKKTAVKKKTNE